MFAVPIHEEITTQLSNPSLLQFSRCLMQAQAARQTVSMESLFASKVFVII